MTDAPYVLFDADGLAVLVGEVQATQLEQSLLGLLGDYLASIPAPVPSTGPTREASRGGGGSSGCCTQDQFAALAQCESGGVNGWRTGLYGIEAGYPIGNLSIAEQQAWVERIFAQYGARAWGCSQAFSQ